MAVLVGMGEKMAERFLPIYLIALGSGMLWPGVLNALNNLLGALNAFAGAARADGAGAHRRRDLHRHVGAGYRRADGVSRRDSDGVGGAGNAAGPDRGRSQARRAAGAGSQPDAAAPRVFAKVEKSAR